MEKKADNIQHHFDMQIWKKKKNICKVQTEMKERD